MKVFIIGATGYIGRSVAARLLAGGHSVVGLARSGAAADALALAGVEPRRVDGGLEDVEAIAAAAAECDAVIDVAAHDMPRQIDTMKRLCLALTAGKVFIGTTGAYFYGDVPESGARPVTEEQPFGWTSREPLKWTPAERRSLAALARVWPSFEAAVLGGAGAGLRSCVVRPPVVYGNGGGGVGGGIPGRVKLARQRGRSVFVDDGRGGAVSTVHVDDLGDLYALLLEGLASGALPPGSLVNASSGAISQRELAEGIAAAGGGLPVVRLTLAEAEAELDTFAIWRGTLMSLQDSSKAAGLGWAPMRASLLEDLTAGSYGAGVRSGRL